MLYKVTPWGYFGRVSKISQGPWFKEDQVENDGLEFYYMFIQGGQTYYLLSNNIPIVDRDKLQNVYYALSRNSYLGWFGGLWLGVEAALRVPYLRACAPGWRFLSIFGTAFVAASLFNDYNSFTYGPIASALLKRHSQHAKTDLFQITDRKREFYEIDTSQYMNYQYEDIQDEYHTHHGPQPDGEGKDSSWLVEMDKFLRGEHNHLKEHKNFINYDFQYKNKDYPTVQDAHNLFHAKETK
mmetsp:Transcript_36907/g.35634  ORF Transcript_36907/g.35634 Transcript_36907/m.35634 type:complete len:240 (+) Transcript_36907:1-720(+)